MKLKAPDAVAARARSPTNWFSGICLAASFAMIARVSGAVAPPSAEELNGAEKWVVERVTAGAEADLRTQFPEKDRKLSAQFVQDLLTGNLTGVKLHRNGVRIIGAIIDEPIDISNAQIPWEVWLNNCQFSSAAIFVRANFAGTVSFEYSTFKADANFNGMKVGQLAVFNNAVFEGLVDFGSADIAGHFEAIEAKFKDKVKGASFNSMKVRDTAFFGKAQFEGWVSFLLADFTQNFEADEAQFKNKEYGVDFYGMKVGKFASFNKAVFEGRVEFHQVDIAGHFHALGAEFRSKTETVWLTMNCRGNGNFTGAQFSGLASFAKSTFLDLVVGYTNRDAAPVAQLDLSRSLVKRQLLIEKIRIRDLDARWLRAEGSTDFTDLIVEHSVDLSNADFNTLDLSRSVWPKDGNDGGVFHMQGMSYKYICAVPGNEPESHQALLTLADQSAYTADVYSNLEEFFLRQGYHGDADEAFIAKKRREREEYFRSGQWSRWLGSWMLNLLVAYGRRPWQAGIPCAV